MDTARRSKRYPSDKPLLVRCDNWVEFVELYAADIGQGGMFIVTDEPPPILSVIEIRMQLPEATEILLRARVVHVVEPEQASAGKTAGVGVEFLELDGERKRQIFHLIEFARWQGATGDPNASLARTMAELSPSLPPKQLGTALPNSTPGSVGPNPRKITLDGTEKPARAGDGKDPRKITLDGTEKPARPGDSKDPRKITLDGVEKGARVSSRAPAPSPSLPPGAAGSSSAPPNAEAASSERPGSGKSADPAKIKVIVTHFAHKRYDVGIKECAQLLVEHPGDAQALKWQAMCQARKSLAANDAAAAVQHYERALQLDEGNREARDFVRNYHREKRLASLPFGRYFTKKK